MGRLMVAWLFAAGMSAASPGETAVHRFEFTRVEMAVPFKIILYANDASAATGQAEAAFARVHALNAILSDYDEQSELNRLCRTAGQGKPVRVSDDLWKVLVRAKRCLPPAKGRLTSPSARSSISGGGREDGRNSPPTSRSPPPGSWWVTGSFAWTQSGKPSSC